MPGIDIRCAIFAAVVFFLHAIVAIGATAPLVSPLNAEVDSPTQINQPSDYDVYLDYDPCAMTAYGEPLYFEENTSDFFQIADMEAEYQKARMAFLFGNYEYAYKVWEPLAYQGYAEAQATLAWMFHTGKGVNKNMQRALAWYRLAADNNHPIAQNNLGVFYEQGIEVGKSYRSAAKWYQKAAEVGYPYAQYNLGILYLEGKGVKKNKDEAIYWLQIASLQGVKQAGERLEQLGQHAPKDEIHSTAKPKQHYHGSPLPVKVPAAFKDVTWIEKQNPDNFTLHLGGSYDLGSLLSVAKNIPNQSDVAYYEIGVKGKRWFTLIYGSFKDTQTAKSALKKLPDDVKQWSPLVRKFAELQEVLRSMQ